MSALQSFLIHVSNQKVLVILEHSEKGQLKYKKDDKES